MNAGNNVAQKRLGAVAQLFEERSRNASAVAVEPEATTAFAVEGLFLAVQDAFTTEVTVNRLGRPFGRHCIVARESA